MSIAFVIGMIFSPLAAVMAFLITYHEYRRHYSTPGPARRAAFETALFTLAVFLVLSWIAGVVLERSLANG